MQLRSSNPEAVDDSDAKLRRVVACEMAPAAQNGAIRSVQINDVADDTHRVLRERAARADQSLQEYLLSRLIADASQPTLEEVIDHAATQSGAKISFSDAVSHLRAERDRR